MVRPLYIQRIRVFLGHFFFTTLFRLNIVINQFCDFFTRNKRMNVHQEVLNVLFALLRSFHVKESRPLSITTQRQVWATSLLSQFRQLYYALVAKEVVNESIDSRGREGWCFNKSFVRCFLWTWKTVPDFKLLMLLR